MDLDQAIAPIRPLTRIVGTVLIIAGVLKFFGVAIPVSGSGIELAAIGFFCRAI